MIYPENNTERNRAIVHLYENGYSYGRIAHEMRLTRNQVAGVVYRSGAQRATHAAHKCMPAYNTPEYWRAA